MAYEPDNPKQNWLPAYVRSIADDFGLTHWRFVLDENNPPNGALADFGGAELQYLGTLRFGEDFWTLSREDQRATVIHELLHTHFSSSARWATKQPEFPDFFDRAFWHIHEYEIDNLSMAIAQKYPLPPKVKRRG